ncbi:unnamed protein product, partial [Ectocarpus sp. 8 AP-2014]
VQQLRARVFEEITAASLEKDGEGVGEVPRAVGSGDTQAVAAAAAAAAAAARSGTSSTGGGGTQAGRDPSPEPFAALFAPPGQNGGSSVTVQAAAAAAAAAASAAKAPAAISAPRLSTSIVVAGGAGPADGASAAPAGSPFLSPQNGNDSTSLLRQRQPQQPQQQPQPQATLVRSANRPLLPKPPAVAGNDPAQAGGANGTDVGGGNAFSAGGGTTTAAAAAAAAAAAGVSRPRTASETTPEDFRLGSGGAVRGYSTAVAAAAAAAASATTTAPPTKRKKVDHTDLVNRVMAQISTLNLPLAATALLVQSLQAKIGSPNFIQGGGGAAAIAAVGGEALGGNGNLAQGARGERGGALSLEERQLLLEERLQASREAESAQTLAERRLKLMEEMRAAGNNQVVTDEVLQNQRRVVLGL